MLNREICNDGKNKVMLLHMKLKKGKLLAVSHCLYDWVIESFIHSVTKQVAVIIMNESLIHW